MRIGILTFCNANNLGAALQAYSLHKTIEEMGHDAELIDYRCPSIENMHKFRPVFRGRIAIKPRIYNLLYNLVFFRRRCLFRQFRRKLKKSKPYTRENISETNQNYDIFISGSDQVFNLRLTGNDSTFFLDFVEMPTRTSYAASIGAYLEEKREQYLTYLQAFKFLSVREKSSQEILQKELHISAEVMPDPVFLHTGDEWKKLIGIKEHKRQDRYLLVYALIEDPKLYRVAKEIAQTKGYKIYVITKALRPLGVADRFYRNVGPEQFVDLIANSSHVVTNSFHGTAFSLVFLKQFSIVLPSGAPDRIVDLLDYFGLSEHICHDNISTNEIDYGTISDLMTNLVRQGKEYLLKITTSKGN